MPRLKLIMTIHCISYIWTSSNPHPIPEYFIKPLALQKLPPKYHLAAHTLHTSIDKGNHDQSLANDHKKHKIDRIKISDRE